MADDDEETAQDLVTALIAAACRRDPQARLVVVRLLAAISEIAHEFDEADRAEISSIMHEAALELEEQQTNKHSNGFHVEMRNIV
jgi:hypothetical protein